MKYNKKKGRHNAWKTIRTKVVHELMSKNGTFTSGKRNVSN